MPPPFSSDGDWCNTISPLKFLDHLKKKQETDVLSMIRNVQMLCYWQCSSCGETAGRHGASYSWHPFPAPGAKMNCLLFLFSSHTDIHSVSAPCCSTLILLVLFYTHVTKQWLILLLVSSLFHLRAERSIFLKTVFTFCIFGTLHDRLCANSE